MPGAGVDLEILPYGTTTPEALMAAGQAECGISFQDALTFAAAGGAPIVSVMAILQHTAQEIAVLDSSSITRPRELDGKTYAGFGYPNEEPTLKSVIKADGGKGTFTTVTLDTAAYEALYAKKADFVITFAAWEGIEAEQRGIKLRTFKFGDYGFPDFYQVVIACDSRWLASHAELARAFVGRDRPRVRGRGRRPGWRRGHPRRPEPRRVRRFARAARRQPEVPRRGRLPARRLGRGRASDARAVAGLFGLPVRPGPADRPRRQAADRGTRLRGVVHERLPTVTSGSGVVGRWGPPVLLVAALVLIWEVYVRLAGLDPIVLPPPSRVVGSLWDAREVAAGHLVPTLVEALTGCAVSVVLATLTAIALDRWAPVRRAVEPLLVTSQTIPIVAIAPLFVIWFGFGLLPKVVIVVLVTFFPVDGRAARRVRAGGSGGDDVAAVDGGHVAPDVPRRCAGRRPCRRCSPVCGSASSTRSSARSSGSTSARPNGLGIWMKLSQNSFRTDLVFAAILLTAIVSFALYLAVGVAERFVVPWSPPIRARANARAMAGRPASPGA